MAKTKNNKKSETESNKSKLKVILLGGLGEVGKNLTILEYEEDILIIDCGLGFPDDEMLGVDLVIPDTTYLEKNLEKVRGVVLTHGHEDHIGALPYVLQDVNVPVYGTRLTLGILELKLSEHIFDKKPQLNCIEAGETVTFGVFAVEFIHVNHSIADACALAITTPVGIVIHSGDFKLDLTPIESKMMDLTRLGELGNKGVLLLMCESTNAERPGYTPSEKKVGQSLDSIFLRNRNKRILISTFSSNVHRVQQIINISALYNRKVAITGRSMLNVITAATELGYMKIPSGLLIDINEIKRYKPENTTIITTGSQGEPMSALYRMAFSDHDKVELGPNDLVVLSAYAIPGNERLVDKIVNEILKRGATVFRDSMIEVHVSGHACQEELKLMQALTRPKFFMPVHGEYKHLVMHKDLAVQMGMPEDKILISETGKVLEFDADSAKFNGTVPSGPILVDGYGVGDVGNIVLRDRRHLAQDGLIVVVATVDIEDNAIISGPDIVSRGFVYVRESEELMDQVRIIARDTLEDCIEHNIKDWTQLKIKVKDDLSKFLYAKTKRKPMILPVIMNV
ncbi:MAG: ribonuclease J [Oscillospiraceae bacterium]|nr:ribonuclease J [Oscillospiraceae bacterium]